MQKRVRLSVIVAAGWVCQLAAEPDRQVETAVEPGMVAEEPAMDEVSDGERVPAAPPGRVYRSVDERGRVRYSDRPEQAGNGEAIDVKQPNTITITPSRPLPDSSSQPAGNNADLAVSITSPIDGLVLQNPADAVPVKASVSPSLPTGFQQRLLSNGKVLDDMALPRPDRGTYQLKVQVLDEKGMVAAESPVITIYVKRASRLLPAKG